MQHTTRWIILRTSGPRTLKLAESLRAAGVEAWTPVGRVRRRFRNRQRDYVDAPILPTFVFAPAETTPALLLRDALDPISDHPPFSIFRDRDRIPVVADASLSALREEERKSQYRATRDTRRTIVAGTAVRPTSGAWAGLTGTVVASKGRQAEVVFGNGFAVKIATYLLADDVLGASPIAA